MEDLIRAARQLLNRGDHLDAVQVLHAEIAGSTGGPAPTGEPARYSSTAEARRHHERLYSEWSARNPPSRPPTPLEQLLRRRPAWSVRVAVGVIALGLTLRYAWAVTHPKNWAQQHPEGNWISRVYSNDRFQGFPLVRYDVGVNADFGARGPADQAPKDGFSARWDTCIVVTQDVILPLRVHSDDSSQVFVDGQLQIEITPGPGEKSASVTLRPGLRQLRVEFVEKAGMALIQLEGLELEGTEAYSFRRPVIDGNEVRCL